VRGVAVAGGFRHLAGASVLTIVAFSPPRGAPVPPALIEQRRLPTTISLSKLNHAALVLAVYASQLSFPLSRSYGHARLASGWWPTFTGRGSRPRKVPNEVSVSARRLHDILLIQAFATQSMAELDSERASRWDSGLLSVETEVPNVAGRLDAPYATTIPETACVENRRSGPRRGFLVRSDRGPPS
jgi:hypothetical protein